MPMKAATPPTQTSRWSTVMTRSRDAKPSTASRPIPSTAATGKSARAEPVDSAMVSVLLLIAAAKAARAAIA